MTGHDLEIVSSESNVALTAPRAPARPVAAVAGASSMRWGALAP
jgi:hypothetical protein